jgi:hypothetical protein
MDAIKNPYSPGAGSPPPELVGRDNILRQAEILLARTRERRPEKSLLLTGLRGVGKTVLLNEIERRAITAGYRTMSIEATGEKPLGVLIAPYLRTLLFDLDRMAGAQDKVKRGLRVLGGFLGNLKLTYSGISIGLDIDPEEGVADSGDIEIDLPNLFIAIAEAAADRSTVVAIFIDEIQYFSSKELGALIMAMHKMQQRRLPLVLIAGGLPILFALVGESKSYAERLFNFPEIGALTESDAARALQDPAEEQGVSFEPGALEAVYRLTHGYPYFVQEWGYRAWNLADTTPISIEVIRRATTEVVNGLDNNFFRVRYDRLTPAEKTFLRAMAELGSGPQRTAEVADCLHVKLGNLSPVRASLLKKGMVYSPAHGHIAFTVPMFDEFMVRTMPDFQR